MQRSYKHHYVPEWYQKRFMLEAQTAYFRLDLFPRTIKTPSGKTVKKGEITKKGPGKFFFEVDLYTTQYFGQQNDDIERHLFGKIDTEGQAAVDALASEDWRQRIHPHIQNFYEYMDAQRLRTPKGLYWLTSVVQPASYNELLMSMQQIRRMHCTMWVEASMEVVSAEQSPTKFLVSDNPVTLFNSVFYPGRRECEFPFDPGIELKGTRTIYPLDLNHCAILTNLEYARSPGSRKASKVRTHPRLFDSTIIKYDDIIRERELNEQQVLAINYILKKRAQKFIAAADKDWLFPESYLKRKDWRSLDKVFISKSVKLLGKGGEIFIGGRNGELLATQDDFGRKPKTRDEWIAKEKQAKEMREHVGKLLRKQKKI
ncbi:DUF4238 domain-containing protein [Marinobacter salicampi]|uniref:DUF4238 domain-containing protein n=1 Tax=Marinobacter salicampi TaxID=435907 RepID=UPI001408A10D|nr:DUF4238 domain-containing protein [Marinobacter salicampi]